MTCDTLRLRNCSIRCETIFIALCIWVLVDCQQPQKQANEADNNVGSLSNIPPKHTPSPAANQDHGIIGNHPLFDYIDDSKSVGNDSTNPAAASYSGVPRSFGSASSSDHDKGNHDADGFDSHTDYDYSNYGDYDHRDDHTDYQDGSLTDDVDKIPHIILGTKVDTKPSISKVQSKPEVASVSVPSKAGISSSPTPIRCAQYQAPKVSPGAQKKSETKTGGRDERDDNKETLLSGNATEHEWEVDFVNYTIVTCESDKVCYAMWMTDPARGDKVEVKRQGCWMKVEEECNRNACVADSGSYPNTRFCCCNSDMCNIHLKDAEGTGGGAYGKGRGHGSRTTPITSVVVSSSVGPLIDNSYREKTIIIALVSVGGVAFIVILAYLSYRLCLTHKPLHVSPNTNGGGSELRPSEPATTTDGYMSISDTEWDGLKFEQMISRGQFSEVWKGELGSQEVAIKVYHSSYKQYYLNECNCYTLPYIQHENLVKFYGARENRKQNRQQQQQQQQRHPTPGESRPNQTQNQREGSAGQKAVTTRSRSGSGVTSSSSSSSAFSGVASQSCSGEDLSGVLNGIETTACPAAPTDGYLMLLEYHSLGSLKDYLKQHTLDANLLFSMGQDVARGLAHLHNQISLHGQFKPALAHRDLNSRNILVTSDLRCVLTDLGFCTAMMGSCLLKNGTIESTEQASLAEVGTIRYLAPEVFDGAVNLRDCEASLKQVDVYSLGLVLWELAFRCVHLYQGAPIPDYQLPYQAEAGLHPSFSQMQNLVVRYKTRPKFPEVWKDSNPAVRSLKETIEDCWDTDPEARLTALCVQERFSDMAVLWVQGSRQRGVTPTLNKTKNLSGSPYQHTVSPSAFVSNGMAFLPEFVTVVDDGERGGGGDANTEEEEEEEEDKITREERSVRLSLIQNETSNGYGGVRVHTETGSKVNARRSGSSSDFSKAGLVEIDGGSASVILMGNTDDDGDDDTDDGGNSITRPLIGGRSEGDDLIDNDDDDFGNVRRSLTRDVSVSGSTVDTWLIPTPSADEEHKAIIVTPTSVSSSSTSSPSPFVSTSPSNYNSNTYPHSHSSSSRYSIVNYYTGGGQSSVSPSTTLTSSSAAASGGLKSSNVNSSLNSTVLRPHQGRNPTVERNTHKSSDEELRVSGNHLISRGNTFPDSSASNIQVNIDGNGEVLSLLPLALNKTDAPTSENVNVNHTSNLYLSSSGDLNRPVLSPVGAVANSNFMNGYESSMEAAESSSLVQNDTLSNHHQNRHLYHQQQQQQQQYTHLHQPHQQQQQHHLRSSNISASSPAAPIPYLQNQVSSSYPSTSNAGTPYYQPSSTSTTFSSSSSCPLVSRPKIANILSNGENYSRNSDINESLHLSHQHDMPPSSSSANHPSSHQNKTFTELPHNGLETHLNQHQQEKTRSSKNGQKQTSIKSKLLSSKPISKLFGHAVLKMKTSNKKHDDSKSITNENAVITRIQNQKNSSSPATSVQDVELRVPDQTSTSSIQEDSSGLDEPRRLRTNIPPSHRDNININCTDADTMAVLNSAAAGGGTGNGEYYNGGLELSPTRQDGLPNRFNQTDHQPMINVHNTNCYNGKPININRDPRIPTSSNQGISSVDVSNAAVLNLSNCTNGGAVGKSRIIETNPLVTSFNGEMRDREYSRDATMCMTQAATPFNDTNPTSSFANGNSSHVTDIPESLDSTSPSILSTRIGGSTPVRGVQERLSVMVPISANQPPDIQLSLNGTSHPPHIYPLNPMPNHNGLTSNGLLVHHENGQGDVDDNDNDVHEALNPYNSRYGSCSNTERNQIKDNKNTKSVPGGIVNPILTNGTACLRDDPLVDSTKFKKSFDSYVDHDKNTNKDFGDKSKCRQFDRFQTKNRLLSKKANDASRTNNAAINSNHASSDRNNNSPVSGTSRPEFPPPSRKSYPPYSCLPSRLRQSADETGNTQNGITMPSVLNNNNNNKNDDDDYLNTSKIPPPDSCFIPIHYFDDRFVSPSSPSVVIPMSNHHSNKEFKNKPASSSSSSSSSSLSSLSSISLPSPRSVEKNCQEKKSQTQIPSQSQPCRKNEPHHNCDKNKLKKIEKSTTGNILTRGPNNSVLREPDNSAIRESDNSVINANKSPSGGILKKSHVTNDFTETSFTADSGSRHHHSGGARREINSNSNVVMRGYDADTDAKNVKVDDEPLSRQRKTRPKSLPIHGYYANGDVHNGAPLELDRAYQDEDGDVPESTNHTGSNSNSASTYPVREIPPLKEQTDPSQPSTSSYSASPPNNILSNTEQEELTKDYNMPVLAVPTVSLDKLPPSTFNYNNNIINKNNNNNNNKHQKPLSHFSNNNNNNSSDKNDIKGDQFPKSKKADSNSTVTTQDKVAKTTTALSKTGVSGPRSKSLKENRRKGLAKDEVVGEVEGEEKQQQREAREKIRRRIKTPVSFKNARLSLYDDRLMGQSLDLEVMMTNGEGAQGQDGGGGGDGVGGNGGRGCNGGVDMSKSLWNGATVFAEMRL